jgi:transposase
MPRPYRKFSPEDKMRILRSYLVEKVPLSSICQEHQISAAQVYLWQNELFNDGALVFQPIRKPGRPDRTPENRVRELERQLTRKQEALAEALSECVKLKKRFGVG